MPDSPEYKNLSGWKRRFTACEPKLSEAMEQYREAGFEVLLVNLTSDMTWIGCIKNEKKYICRDCYNGAEEKYRVIYTRPQKGP